MIKNNMSKKLYIFFVIISLTCMQSCENSSENKKGLNDIVDIYHQRKSKLEDGWEIYLDNEKKIIVKYPSNWMLEKSEGTVFNVTRVDSLEKVFLENFHLAIVDNEDNKKIEDFANDFFESQKSSYSNFLFKDKETGYVKSYEDKTYWVSYNLKAENDFEIFTISVFFKMESKVYLLNFYTIPERKEKNWILFENVVNNLVIQ